MSGMASQITNLTIVYWTVYSGADQRKHESSASLAFVRGIHRWPVNSPHKGPVTRKMFPFDYVIIIGESLRESWWRHQMETFSALLAICAGNSPVPGEFPAQRPVTWSFDFSFICVWTNDWLNDREAGDLRRNRAHYDVMVMRTKLYCEDTKLNLVVITLSWRVTRLLLIISFFVTGLERVSTLYMEIEAHSN